MNFTYIKMIQLTMPLKILNTRHHNVQQIVRDIALVQLLNALCCVEIFVYWLVFARVCVLSSLTCSPHLDRSRRFPVAITSPAFGH